MIRSIYSLLILLLLQTACGTSSKEAQTTVTPQMEDRDISTIPRTDQPAKNTSAPKSEPDKASNAAAAASPSNQMVYNRDRVYNQMVQSVRLFPQGEPIEAPILQLGSPANLELHFDVLGKDVYDFHWRIQLCDWDWEPTDLTFFQYADGFERQEIRDFKYSFQTKQNFVHYTASIPGNDLSIQRSGNYLLLGYEVNNPDRPVFSKRFYVVEPQVSITGSINRSLRPTERSSHQELRFDVNYKGVDISNPYGEIKVSVIQNGRWDNAVNGLEPKFVRNESLVFESDELSFPAGKEWRYFSTRSIRFLTERIKKANRNEEIDSLTLVTDQNRSFREYRYRADMNGNYFVAIDESDRDELEADYVWMHFSLPYPALLTDGEMYVFGALSDFDFRKGNKMTYNQESKTYELDLFLKQGYYNYMYAFVPHEKKQAELYAAEGSHFQSENDYRVMVYQHDFNQNYDRLIGTTSFNSAR